MAQDKLKVKLRLWKSYLLLKWTAALKFVYVAGMKYGSESRICCKSETAVFKVVNAESKEEVYYIFLIRNRCIILDFVRNRCFILNFVRSRCFTLNFVRKRRIIPYFVKILKIFRCSKRFEFLKFYFLKCSKFIK